MKQAIITQQNDRVAFQTPYNPEFLTDLKNAIPHTDREWDRANKVWLVTEVEAEKAIEVTRRHFEVVDGRGKSADEVEEVQIEAEIAQIQANQAALLEKEEYVEKVIDALDTAIGRYSYRSKSAIKGALARDRALLAHSLDNARLPIERLTELHVRGLGAALRLIEGGYDGPRGSHVRL